MSRTVSAKIPNKLHEDLRERCNRLGCTVSEYVENCIDFLLNGQSEFEFDLEPENEAKIEPIQEEKPLTEGKIIGIEPSEMANIRIIP